MQAEQEDLFGGPPQPAQDQDQDQDQDKRQAQAQADDAAEARDSAPGHAPRPRRTSGAQPAPVDPPQQALADTLPPGVHLGTSSWSYPGWQGLVWAGRHSESLLSRTGLSAYSRQPLLRAVGIDRGFYQPLTASQYERHAQQVPAHFRFTVKAPSLVTDALVRAEDGRGKQPNPAFLDPTLAVQEFIQPALEGLGGKIGALVFQLSPLPLDLLGRMPEQLERLRQLLLALPTLKAVAPQAVVAVEVRDPEWLTPAFVAVLREAGACYCLGLHPKLPPIRQQLPLLRAMWPGPLVCRWNLHPRFGPYGYEDAERRYGDYDQLLDPDDDTRAVLAQVIRGTASAGQPVYVTISNHAEGSAPRSVRALAEQIVGPLPAAQAPG